jgi:PAS domain S-box-containing protein
MKTIPALELLSAPFEASLDGVMVIDDDDRIIYANPAACAITGAQLDELLGRDAMSYMPPHERESFQQLVASKQPGSMLRGSMTMLRPTGDELHVDYTAVPIVVDGR